MLGLIASRLPNDGVIAVAALGYGLVLYLVNFQLLGRTVLPQFQNTNQPFEVFAHVVFAARRRAVPVPLRPAGEARLSICR